MLKCTQCGSTQYQSPAYVAGNPCPARDEHGQCGGNLMEYVSVVEVVMRDRFPTEQLLEVVATPRKHLDPVFTVRVCMRETLCEDVSKSDALDAIDRYLTKLAEN